MLDLKQSYIDSLAPNASAISSAKGLGGKFSKLYISEDESLLFGECAGSGKSPYSCSVDFINKESPVARCSCPSRQIPCKHALGLMYCYASGKKFETGDIPEDITSKRGKIEKRLENKEKRELGAKQGKEATPKDAAPTKAKITAAVKKTGVQLEGIEVAELLLKNMLQTGIAGIDAAAAENVAGQVKKLGNYHISGIQNAFNDIVISLKNKKEENFDKIIEQMIYAAALLKKAREHLEVKAKDESKLFTLDTASAIEEQIGHIWTLAELSNHNMFIDEAQLVQLAFYSYNDESRREFIDESFYFCLNNGEIYAAYNYRPHKALKYVKEEDSRYELIEIPKMYIYPGNINPRVRWDSYTMSEVKSANIAKVKATAKTDYTEVVKSVKNQIINPLSTKNPVVLLDVADVCMTETDNGAVHLHIVDKSGTNQILADKGHIDVPTVPVLSRFDKKLLCGNALLVMFTNDAETGILSAKPLAVISDSQIVRLVY